MTQTIKKVSNRYKRWLALWMMLAFAIIVPTAFALDVEVMIFAVSVCEDNLSHVVVVQWNVNNVADTATIKIEVALPDGTSQSFNSAGNQGSQSFNVDQPMGGVAAVELTARGDSSLTSFFMIVTAAATDSVSLPQCRSSDCPGSRRELASRLLPSITAFSLVDFNAFDALTEFPVPVPQPSSMTNNFGTEVVPISIARETLGPVGTGDQGNAFNGTDANGNGVVSTYVLDDQISGFLQTDGEWIFVEPLQFLLREQLQSEAMLRSFDPNGECSLREYLALLDDMTLFPFGLQTHIVYNTKDTDFVIQLEQSSTPSMASDHDHHPSTELQFEHEATSEPAPHAIRSQQGPTLSRVSVLPFGDSAFRLRYLNTKESWLDAQLEVLNLVRTFYIKANVLLDIAEPRVFDDSSPVPVEQLLGQENPIFNALPDQNGDGINDLNAFTLLCHFAQGIPNAPEVPPVTDDISSPFISHLFTGHDLGPVFAAVDSPQLSDSGCCLCEANCGMEGPNIIGLAEGIGGIWRTSSSSCRSPLGNLDPSANHSLSQQSPKPNSNGTNENYQATLYQRFLIVTHEIGHTLSLAHSDNEQSVMHASLINEPQGNTIEFKVEQTELEGVSKDQIDACLNPEIEPCKQD